MKNRRTGLILGLGGVVVLALVVGTIIFKEDIFRAAHTSWGGLEKQFAAHTSWGLALPNIFLGK